jgi:hypothetical protein
MTPPGPPRRKLFRIGIILAVPVLLFGTPLLLSFIFMAEALPPKKLKTIEQFETWKRGSIRGRGTFESSGVVYQVVLAPSGRFLASGPSAYLFDEHGLFVDWTADMGDFYTVKNRFDLTSGNVKNIRRERP